MCYSSQTQTFSPTKHSLTKLLTSASCEIYIPHPMQHGNHLHQHRLKKHQCTIFDEHQSHPADIKFLQQLQEHQCTIFAMLIPSPILPPSTDLGFFQPTKINHKYHDSQHNSLIPLLHRQFHSGDWLTDIRAHFDSLDFWLQLPYLSVVGCGGAFGPTLALRD